MAVNPKSGFASSYVRALSGAALVFGATHAVDALILSAFRDGVSSPHFSALLSLSFFEAVEVLIFFVIGMFAAFAPVRVADKYIDRSATGVGNMFVWLGLLAGLTYLPLCAGVSAMIMPSVDDPGYLQRCLEYLLPMATAGVTGGHIFGITRWSSTSGGL